MKKEKMSLVFTKLKWVMIVLTILSTIIGMIIYRLINWVFNTWGLLNLEEILFTLRSPLQGTNNDMIKEAIIYCVPITMAFLIIACMLMFAFRKKIMLQYISMSIIIITTVMLGATAIRTAWNELSVSAFIENKKQRSTFVSEQYKDPNEVALTFPEKKTNFIYKIKQTNDTTYASKENGGAYDVDYIPELTQIAKENINFSSTELVGGGVPSQGATWTIGGLFTQSSGLPLMIPTQGNAMNEQATFFPTIKTLGDILLEQGYNQTFMIGSEAEFGGRDKYFLQHGNYEIKDYNYAIENEWIPEDYRVWWGYEDKKLFENAKTELVRLSQQEQPFNLTMLTVDTHFEDGYLCDICEQVHGADQYGNVISCSSKQLAEFIQWIQSQDFYENTTIILSGDHLTMDSNFCENIGEYERTAYNAFINSAIQPVQEKNRQFATFDMFPSTLASLGVEIEGDRLGIGTNLFSDKKTLSEEYTIDYIDTELSKGSDFYDNVTKDIINYWIEEEDGWYYINENGNATGWQLIDGEWYFFYENGLMAADTTIDGYTIGSNGVSDKER